MKTAKFKNIMVKASTYRKVAKYKSPGESFSDLFDREFTGKIVTADDLLALCKSRKGVGLGLRQRKTKRKVA